MSMTDDTDASNNILDPSASPIKVAYCLLCDEVVNTDVRCKHYGLNVGETLKEFVDLVNANINSKQKEARSIQFYLFTSRAIREGKETDAFNVLDICGFKDFIRSKYD